MCLECIYTVYSKIKIDLEYHSYNKNLISNVIILHEKRPMSKKWQIRKMIDAKLEVWYKIL